MVVACLLQADRTHHDLLLVTSKIDRDRRPVMEEDMNHLLQDTVVMTLRREDGSIRLDPLVRNTIVARNVLADHPFGKF